MSLPGDSSNSESVRRKDRRQGVLEAHMHPVHARHQHGVAGQDGQHHGADRDQAVGTLDELAQHLQWESILMASQRMDAAVDEGVQSVNAGGR